MVADERTDCANWEQLGKVIRYVYQQKPVERLIEYVKCGNIRGETIANLIIESLKSNGIDISGRFFASSPKRQRLFEKIIQEKFDQSTFNKMKKKIKHICETRWVERHRRSGRLILVHYFMFRNNIKE